LRTAFDAIATLDFAPSFEQCVALASGFFLEGL
jgi:hypothetical protein